MRTEQKLVLIFSFAILVCSADLKSEICQPASDGQSCSQITCPDSNLQCIPTKIRIDYNSQLPTYTVLECECMDLQNDCHININPQFEVYITGTCPDSDYPCQLIEIDNGDGTIDYECACEPILQELDGADLPGQASNPSPTNGDTKISRNGTTLTWTAGSNAESHDVYFGTTNPPSFVTNQIESTYDTGAFGAWKQGVLYYWRVDEKNDVGIATGNTWSFRIEECMKNTAPEYADWVQWGRPSCWCCQRQCRGDINCSKVIMQWVSLIDLNILKSAYGKTDSQIWPIPNGICADLNHSKNIQRVSLLDLNFLKSYYGKPAEQVPCCDLDGDCVLTPADKYNFWAN